jgi:hypothetical protein
VSSFPPGSSWVLALYRAEERTSEFAISTCGEYWLPVVEGRVRGFISPDPFQTAAPEDMLLEDLASQLLDKRR